MSSLHVILLNLELYTMRLAQRNKKRMEGPAEHKDRNITELGLTMVAHSMVPKFFWVDAFSTAVFFINRMPSSSVLDVDLPFKKLFGRDPEFTSFCVYVAI